MGISRKQYLTYLVSTPLINVENTRHFPSVDVVASRICSKKKVKIDNKTCDTRVLFQILDYILVNETEYKR